jgi:hypothetical protein
VIDTCRLWMCLDYVLNRHVLSSLGRAQRPARRPDLVGGGPVISLALGQCR